MKCKWCCIPNINDPSHYLIKLTQNRIFLSGSSGSTGLSIEQGCIVITGQHRLWILLPHFKTFILLTFFIIYVWQPISGLAKNRCFDFPEVKQWMTCRAVIKSVFLWLLLLQLIFWLKSAPLTATFSHQKLNCMVHTGI